MLLGRSEPEIDAGESHKPVLACEPLYTQVFTGNVALSDMSGMGAYLAILLPRLATCRTASSYDWAVLSRGSQYAQLLGSRYMVKYIAWFAAMNAQYADSHYDRCMCLVARMPGGDVKLHTVLPYLNDSSRLGYHAAVRLGEEAYWRKDLKTLDAALERATVFPDDGDTEHSGSMIMELLLLQACRDRLEYGTVNLADVFSYMVNLSPLQRRVYEMDAMHLFLAESDPSTIGMLVQGFGLFRDHQPADGITD